MLTNRCSAITRAGCVLLCVLAADTLLPLAVRADQTIYTDSLQNSWQDWGWAPHSYTNTSPVHSGTYSVSVTVAAWQALYIAHSGYNPSPNTHLRFWIHGGTSGGQQLSVVGHAGGGTQSTVNLPPLATNLWQEFTISLADLGLAGRSDVDGVWFSDRIGASQPTFYLDDISLVIPPGITLTNPVTGANYTNPATINLAALVTPGTHTITQVQFYNGFTLLGSNTASPYTFTWSNVGVGTYGVFARALYDAGDTVDSPTANIVVATNSPATIVVDAQLNRHSISPLVYGVAFATSNQVSDLNTPLNRSGGNAETRYNWQLNAHNRAADWYFESLPDSPTNAGAAADDFVANSKNGGAKAMITIPMIGWSTKLGSGGTRLPSFSVAKYGAQAKTDPGWSDAGNGVSSVGGTNITNDPNDANFPTNSTFQAGYVQHLTNRWGLSTNGGVRYYLMDNEHSIWQSTHRDIHPVGPTMQEIRDKFFDYAGMVKAIDPNTLILAPEEWGWNGYLYSGYDQQWSGAHGDYNPAHYPDRAANGGWDYGPWLLNQFYQRATNTNQRLLDYFTFHCYPQENNVGGNDVSYATVLLRNESTRVLWDTNYVDASWINSVIMLIPRMRNWVTTYYPGTKIGVTEYNWGAEGNINGATAQADILGIFGRENLDLATRWTTPDPSTPTYKAMKMYRNYDGAKSTFGNLNANVVVANPDLVSAFASLRSTDGALMVMAINKQLYANAVLTATFTNFLASGAVQVWRLNMGNSIARLADLSLSANTLNTALPPQSITLFVLAAGAPPPPPQLVAGVYSNTNTFDLWLNGTAGQRYILLSSSNLLSWLPVQTNTLSSSSWHVILPATKGPPSFYRGQWAP
jgi:hypothetical protein